MRCSVLQCVAASCVLQCVAVCCSVLQCIAVSCSVLQRVAVCVVQCVAAAVGRPTNHFHRNVTKNNACCMSESVCYGVPMCLCARECV